MAKKEKAPSLSERLEEIQETLKELKAKDERQRVDSLPPSQLQKHVEQQIAPQVGMAPKKTWSTAKDIGRSIVPTEAEAWLRYKLRGETYESAKDKIEEYKEDLETRRPTLALAGKAVTAAAGTAGMLWVYNKAGNFGAKPAAPATPAGPALPNGAPIPVAKGTAVARAANTGKALATAAKVARAAPKTPLGLAIAATVGLGALVAKNAGTATRFYRSGPKAGRLERYVTTRR